jgi:hypothetical protein
MAAVAIIEWVDGDEPQMRLCCFQDLIDVGIGIEPVEERPHFGIGTFRLRCLKMDLFFSDGTGDDFHRTGAVVAPGSCFDFGHAAAPCRKQGCMPSEEPFVGEGLVVMAGGVEHHFDDAFDVAVGGLEYSGIHAEPPGDRGPDLRGVEFLALYFTALEDIFCECLKDRLLAEVESDASMWPISRPCWCRTVASGSASRSRFQ